MTIDTSRAAVEAWARLYEKDGLEVSKFIRALADERDLWQARAFAAERHLRDKDGDEPECADGCHGRVFQAEARATAFEDAAKAVYDAGGDNTDYHIEAIRAAASQPEQTKERGDG